MAFRACANDVAAWLALRALGPRRTTDSLRAGDGCYADTTAAELSAPASGRMVIEIGQDPCDIVDAGVDAAALARVLAILERR